MSTAAGAYSPPEQRISVSNVAEYARSAISEVEAAADILQRRLTIGLPGLSIRVRTFDGPLADAMEVLHRARDSDEFLDTETVDVFVAHGDLPGMPKPASWVGPYMPHEVAEALSAADLRASHFHDLNHWHLYDPRRRTGVQLMRSPVAFPPWETGAPLRPFLHWYYACRGMRLAHCGTLGLDGNGVMLAGGAGSGKSGTAIAGLLNGLQSVGDDYALLDTSAEIFAYPLFPVLKQDQGGFERLKLGRFLKSGELNWQDKYQFRIQDISTSEIPTRLRIKALLVPRVTKGDKTVITPMPRSASMIALAQSSIYQMPGERESGFRFFGEITSRLPCFSLELGQDPAEISGVIGAFIGRLRDDSAGRMQG